MANSVYIHKFRSVAGESVGPWIRTTGRIDAATAAQILGFQKHDIPILVSSRLLKPLGKPVPNSTKYFAAVDVLEKAEDPDWLSKATQVVADYWQERNASKTKAEPEATPIEP